MRDVVVQVGGIPAAEGQQKVGGAGGRRGHGDMGVAGGRNRHVFEAAVRDGAGSWASAGSPEP